jgi:hypothetical protein
VKNNGQVYISFENSIRIETSCISIISDSFDILIQNVNCGILHGIIIRSIGMGNI